MTKQNWEERFDEKFPSLHFVIRPDPQSDLQGKDVTDEVKQFIAQEIIDEIETELNEVMQSRIITEKEMFRVMDRFRNYKQKGKMTKLKNNLPKFLQKGIL